MFQELNNINSRPEPFEFYTAEELWADEYTSSQMLKYHLNEELDISSRRAEFIDRSVEWIISKFEIGVNKKVADFGCGPGLYCSRLARSGARVTGIDFSKRSIEYARNYAAREKLDIKYINQNYLDFTTAERFDLIIMIMCDFCVLSPVQRKVMLDKFRGLLNLGGSLLLDVYSLNSFAKRIEQSVYEKNQLNGFWSPDDYFGFVNNFKYEKEKVTLDKYTIIEESRKRTIYNWLQYFDPDMLKSEFAEAGFSGIELFSDVSGKEFDNAADEIAIAAKGD